MTDKTITAMQEAAAAAQTATVPPQGVDSANISALEVDIQTLAENAAGQAFGPLGTLVADIAAPKIVDAAINWLVMVGESLGKSIPNDIAAIIARF